MHGLRAMTNEPRAARIGTTLVATCLSLGLLASTAHAMSLTATDINFNEELKILALGGTVTHITNSKKTLTGVSVTLPGWVFASGVSNLVDGLSSEPSNLAPFLVGAPTDITFTQPGVGGPDGGDGDGSVHFKGIGATVTLSFPQTITAPLGVVNDLFLITDTHNGGMVKVEIPGVDPFISSTIFATPYGNPMGGLLLDVPDGFSYSQVTFSVYNKGVNLEIDALAANTTGPGGLVHSPEPGTWILLTIGLLGLGVWRGH